MKRSIISACFSNSGELFAPVYRIMKVTVFLLLICFEKGFAESTYTMDNSIIQVISDRVSGNYYLEYQITDRQIAMVSENKNTLPKHTKEDVSNQLPEKIRISGKITDSKTGEAIPK